MRSLKEAIEKEIGISPKQLSLFFLGFPLEDENVLLNELLPLSKTFNLVLQDEEGDKGLFGKSVCQFFSDKAHWLIRGGQSNFAAIYIKPYQSEPIKLSSKKFGLVQHTEGEEVGKRVFHLRRYTVKKQGRIGREEELTHEEYTTFEESRRKPTSYLSKFAAFFS